MDLNGILQKLAHCPCGREHRFDTKMVEIGHGVVDRVGALLTEAGFDLLAVYDERSFKEPAEDAQRWVLVARNKAIYQQNQ